MQHEHVLYHDNKQMQIIEVATLLSLVLRKVAYIISSTNNLYYMQDTFDPSKTTVIL